MSNEPSSNGHGVINHRLDEHEKRIVRVENDLYGEGDQMGLKNMFLLIWKSHVGVLCAVSGIVGTVVGGVLIYWLTKGIG